MSDQMRLARNDAGHPVSTDPVTHETVHAALLLFLEFAGLVTDLNVWVSASLTQRLGPDCFGSDFPLYPNQTRPERGSKRK